MSEREPVTTTATAVVDDNPDLRRQVQKILEQLERRDKEETAIAQQARARTMADLALLSEADRLAYLTGMEKTLDTLRATAIRRTKPGDWTIYKGRGDTEPVGVPRDSACVEIRKWFGISITGHRGAMNDYAVPGPRVSKAEDDPTVTVLEMWADGYCARTGERIEGIYLALRSDDDFIGRQRKNEDGSHWTTVQDMQASVRTSLDGKITRILSGLRKVPVSELEKYQLDWRKAHLGPGFGTGADRAAGKVAEGGVAEQAKALGDEILRRVGGDVDAARQLLVEISSWKNNEGRLIKGFDSVSKFTKAFQVENAWKALKVHPTFGDKAIGNAAAGGAGREPGAEG